ncbi:MAG: PQQ-like beta-propeller repeat protein [Rickettsiales bacterium]|nr:PQQ-like beta-propeller repeat protein [Rickettsiales bacterium]
MSKSVFFISLSVVFLTISCSGNKKTKPIDPELIVSLSALIKPDDTLKDVGIDIPNQKTIKFWSANIQTNLDIENIYKTFEYKKKSLNIRKSIIYSKFSANKSNNTGSLAIIDKDTAFYLEPSGYLVAVGLESKKINWRKKIFKRVDVSYRYPKIGENQEVIFSIIGDNQVVASRKKDGLELWRKKISAIPIATPIANQNILLILTNDKLYCLNSRTGEIIWIHSASISSLSLVGSSAPIIFQDFIIVGYSSGEIYKLDIANGEVKWSRNLNVKIANNSNFYLNDIDANIILKDNAIYVASNNGILNAFNLENGENLWSKSLFNNSESELFYFGSASNFWLAGSYIYSINSENQLVVIEKKSGKIKQIFNLPHFKNPKKPQTKIIYSGLVMAGDKIIISNVNGDFIIYSPTDNKIEYSYISGFKNNHAPIIVDNKIYINFSNYLFTGIVSLW